VLLSNSTFYVYFKSVKSLSPSVHNCLLQYTIFVDNVGIGYSDGFGNPSQSCCPNSLTQFTDTPLLTCVELSYAIRLQHHKYRAPDTHAQQPPSKGGPWGSEKMPLSLA
jgi:hypothetical protein